MQLSEWLSYQAPKIRSNCKIVTVDCAYHISSNKNIKRFMPMIGNRMAESEDRTIARVCCAATVLDAIRGHSAVAWEQLDAWFDGQFDEFAIYQFPFTEYIKPNRKLVYDAEASNELWVVPNDATTVSFKAPVIGYFMMEEYSQTVAAGYDATDLKYIVRTVKPLIFDVGDVFDGYYRVSVRSKSRLNQPNWEAPLTVTAIEKISSSSYNAVVNKIKRNLK